LFFITLLFIRPICHWVNLFSTFTILCGFQILRNTFMAVTLAKLRLGKVWQSVSPSLSSMLTSSSEVLAILSVYSGQRVNRSHAHIQQSICPPPCFSSIGSSTHGAFLSTRFNSSTPLKPSLGINRSVELFLKMIFCRFKD
jgi:hypothetical protein